MEYFSQFFKLLGANPTTIMGLIFLAVVVILYKIVSTAKFTGWRGEKLSEKELIRANENGRTGISVRNAYVPEDDGKTSEIDVIYVTKKGIFVLESKNYSGWIFGDEKQQMWTQSLPNKQKQRFYNPIKQNKTHIKWLSNYLGMDIPMYSIIVFSKRCELKKVTVNDPKVHVIKRDDLYTYVTAIWDAAPQCITDEQVSEIAEKIKGLTKVSRNVKKQHVESIQERYGQTKQKTVVSPVQPQIAQATVSQPVVTQSSIEQPTIAQPSAIEVPTTQPQMQNQEKICPRCGGKLVLRKAKSGQYAGQLFYGCSNYPRCRYFEKKQ